MQFREYRKLRGLTQEKTAELLGVDRSTVAKWETGVAEPRASLLRSIADVFGCKVDDLLANGDDRTS